MLVTIFKLTFGGSVLAIQQTKDNIMTNLEDNMIWNEDDDTLSVSIMVDDSLDKSFIRTMSFLRDCKDIECDLTSTRISGYCQF